MNQHNLNFVRNELRRALPELSRGVKGQLEAFYGHPLANKKDKPRCSVHFVELEGEKGVRLVNSFSAPQYVLETRSRRRPMPPINDEEFESASWRRAVSTLSNYQQAWLRYCYGFDLSYKHQVTMCEHVWKAYQECLGEPLLQKRVVKKLIGLVWLAGQEIATARNNETYKDYAGAELARMVSVDRSTWLRVYSGHWSGLKSAFSELDTCSLIMVLEKLDQFSSVRMSGGVRSNTI